MMFGKERLRKLAARVQAITGQMITGQTQARLAQLTDDELLRLHRLVRQIEYLKSRATEAANRELAEVIAEVRTIWEQSTAKEGAL
jgi:hypothetical protein